MSEAESSEATGVRTNLSPSDRHTIHEELEVLFEEAAALAGRLRKNARQIHRPENLSAAGRGVLRVLHLLGPQTVPQLARQRSTSRQNVQVLVNRLESAGYTKFLDNPAHKRSELVQLTSSGSDLLASTNRREARMLAGLLPHLTEREILSAAGLLRRLRQLLSGEQRAQPWVRQREPKVEHTDRAKTLAPKAPQLPESMATTSDPSEGEDSTDLPVNLL